MNKQPAVYLLTNRHNGTLYTGVTSNLLKRIWEHKNKLCKGFTEKYQLTNLVYYELHEDMSQAILREKQLKAGSRQMKVNLIDSINPEWRDLYPELGQ